MLIAVHRCLRYSIPKKQKYAFRELYTFATPQISKSPIYVHRPFQRGSPNNLLGIDFVALKGETTFFTGCKSFSKYDGNKPTADGSDQQQKTLNGEKKLSLLQRFRQMYKQYWYVLVPVHIITSCIWFGFCFYAAESGINITELLETLPVPEKLMEKLRDSKAKSLVVAVTLYKLITPFRYMATIGGTTVSINYLRKWGWIKPIPNKEQIKRMYQEQKGAFKDFTSNYQDKMQSKKDDLLKTKEDLKQQYVEARDGFQRSVKETKRDFKSTLKAAASDWKHVGGLLVKCIKKSLTRKN